MLLLKVTGAMIWAILIVPFGIALVLFPLTIPLGILVLGIGKDE